MFFKNSSIFLYSPIRSDIIIETTEHHFFKSNFFPFNKPQSKHFGCISLLSFTRANSIANMSASITKMRQINTMTNLYRSENSIFLIHKKKETCWHSSVIFCEVILCNLQKFLKIFTTKEGSWRNMPSLLFRMIIPLIHKFHISRFVGDVGKFETKHSKKLTIFFSDIFDLRM